jgi:hypothetical protein
MTNLDLDYAVALKPYPLWVRLALALAALVLAASLGLRYQQLQSQLAAQQVAALHSNIAPKAPVSNPQLDETLAFAWATQQNLNFPWMHMLSSLEAVKAQHPNIELLSVTPNKTKSDIMLAGEAKSFGDITQLLNALKANPAFGDAVLVNQHLVEEVNAGRQKGDLIYVFSLKLNWPNKS